MVLRKSRRLALPIRPLSHGVTACPRLHRRPLINFTDVDFRGASYSTAGLGDEEKKRRCNRVHELQG